MSSSKDPIELDNQAKAKRRKDLFGDCALVEIIHLHDCLRGALKALQNDVTQLSKSVLTGDTAHVSELERRVNGRFKVIWSVFRAHSAAEDEFIWPALKSKTGSGKLESPKQQEEQQDSRSTPPPNVVEQEEYVEDHADEERMFSTMDELLAKLRHGLTNNDSDVTDMAKEIDKLTASLMKHLMTHLEKEETQCMPLVLEHLTKSEIHDLVGQIMGKRSSDTIAQIMSMAVQNLAETEREEMVRYMKQAMMGTFFERWLAMSGWMSGGSAALVAPNEVEENDKKMGVAVRKHEIPNDGDEAVSGNKRAKIESKMSKAEASVAASAHMPADAAAEASAGDSSGVSITSQAELEKLIRAIASNPALTGLQKNTTIQGLRDSVWKSNKRHRDTAAGEAPVPQFEMQYCQPVDNTPAVPVARTIRSRRETPPSAYYRKNKDGKVELVWSRDSSLTNASAVPLFTASELAPSYHDGANGAVLGCPHYARACKLRHPSSGRLYVCRLCCEQERENPLKDQDSPLDRYAVTEIFCMRCSALQPASDRCVNPKCGVRFAKYNCSLCNLFDDGPNKNIYHCPFCNVCRSGAGLGIDYRHCMRCNACVSLADDEHHCISQKLQGSCPICHESMFQSTEPLRGLKCGHVLHLKCFSMYMRAQSYTCPLCKKSVEDMKEYFSMLDAAVRMQPMPAAYLSTMSNIYCQDCGQSGQVQYHFVGCKCPHCGSYNTRELGRVQGSTHAS